ncbi:hypothetical protein [Microbacterium soli]|uniref:hypothetical protein n=1 Tax=Microbacterium soli TaxID=446075 RepID=UPI0031D1B9B1
MSENTHGSNDGISRRTVTKAMAWAGPAIAVAATVPIAAASIVVPPPPVFNWGSGFKNPGASCKLACVAKQSYTTPVTVSNPSLEDYIIVFTSYAAGTNAVGINSLYTGECSPVSSTCSSTCTLPPGAKAVCVPAGTTSMTFFVSSGSLGSSPQGTQDVAWEWRRADDCSVADSGVAHSETSPPGSC